jgi:hypothetical protein
MKSKFTIEIEFEDRPLSSDLIASVKMLSELIAKNYAYPFDASGSQTLGFGENRQVVQWRLHLDEQG